MTALVQYLKRRHGAKGRGYWTMLLEPIFGIAATKLALVSFARAVVRGPTARGYCA